MTSTSHVKGQRITASTVKGSVAGEDGRVNLLEQKVKHLEDTLNVFQAEVNKKMQILEQILVTRSDQFIAQTRMLKREQELMADWKNTSKITFSGIDIEPNFCDEYIEDSDEDSKDSCQRKRHAPSAFRRFRKRSMIATKSNGKGVENDDNDAGNNKLESQGSAGDREDTNDVDDLPEKSISDVDDDLCSSGEIERKVYVSYYTTDRSRPGESSNNPVWSYYLREDNGGQTALCKLCDSKSIQKIIKAGDHGTSSLHRHLKAGHGIDVKGIWSYKKIDKLPSLTSASCEHQMEKVPTLTARSGMSHKRKLYSPVWNYFDRNVEEQVAHCTLCEEIDKSFTMKIGDGSTNGLHRHLKTVHPAEYNEMKSGSSTKEVIDTK